ncbi:hypothetical protein G6M87_10935 [Rhizobium rhizogenes]|uniref:hypothetical protein n=1 Tax=Rhizobium rhizogenes TaxID=359 RepID=UPI001571F179|nr:hypothetical protein [Rhizobium rhizogenes]NTI22372.1 hypothetical protein [Rhizobium rhizogenes]QTG05958.1 hypothetical protein G6M87_10935 [Rhizobium rhizogenes]
MTFYTAAEIARFSSGNIRVAFLVEMYFVSKTMGVWNGNRKLTVNGTEFLPMFGAGNIDGLSFTNSTTSDQVTIGVSGVNSDILGQVLSEAGELQDRLVKIYLQSFDDDWQPIAAAPVIFFGYMQPPEGTQDEVVLDVNAASPTHTVTIAAENIYYNRSRSPGGRYSDRDQQYRHPGDKIFDFMPGLVFKTFVYPDF